MAKSKSGSNSSGGDGRRHNRPPPEKTIRLGEIRNPHGRNGKPKPAELSSFHEMYLAESRRVVYRDENGDVDVARRLVQEEIHDALTKGDKAARHRILNELSYLTGLAERQWREAEEWVLSCKAHYSEQFHKAKSTGCAPPDVMHPDHVHARKGEIIFTGPMDRESRKQWEHLKAVVQVAAFTHNRARRSYRQSPTGENLARFKDAEIWRRRVMRAVPKGWNWQEQIYCRHSWTKKVSEIISDLERQT